jgi:DNA-binding winged helix-turn-helix (wHTH) protein/tetratricopeptide (TPR) repeat protein
MTAPVPHVSCYRFEPFEAYPETGQLLKTGVRVKLQEQPFRLLCLLLENQGELVTRETIRDHLWPQNTFVEFDASLRVAVTKLRDALGDDSENPRFIETIPKKGYRFLPPVERVLKPEKSDTRGLVAEPSVAQSSGAAAPTNGAHASSFPSNVLRVLFILAVAVGAVVFFLSRSHVKTSEMAAPKVARASSPVRRSVAILGFRNLPGRHEDDWLSQAFTEMLGTEIGSGGEIRIISDEDVARAKRELPIADQDTLSKATLEKLATNPGADVVLLGAYTSVPAKDGDHIRLDVRLQNTSTGETIAETAVSGNQSDLFDLASRAGSDLRKSLNLNSITPQDVALARASLPSNEAAARYYAEGRAKQEKYDAAGARELLLKAIAADPEYPLAHAYLADAWSTLGFQSRAVAEAKRSLELAWNLPPEGRLALEGAYRRKLGDWDGAAKAYGELHRMRPDNLDYGLQLAKSQYPVNPSLALATLREVRELPSPIRDDPRIDYVESSTQMFHDITAAEAAARSGLAKAAAMKSPTLVAEGYGLLCQQATMSGTSALENIGNCENARRTYMAAGQPNNVARSGNDMAGIYFTQGNLARAESLWRESAAEFRSVGDTSALAAATNNLGDVYIKQGKLSEAVKVLNDAEGRYQTLGDTSGAAGVVSDLALIARERGDLVTAGDEYAHARTMAEQVDDKSTTAIAIEGMGDVEFERGNFPAARKAYERAISIRTDANEKQGAAEAQVSLARLTIAEGHAADAEAVLRKCREQFRAETETEDEMSANTVLIEALTAQGKMAEAASEVASVTAPTTKNQDRIVRMEFEIASAGVSGASGPAAAGNPGTQFERLIAEARDGGLVRLELEARLALGEWEKRAGRATAQNELAAVEKAATAKGFTRIAHEAAAARG